MSQLTVLVCRGKRCAKRHGARDELVRLLRDLADVELVRCQKICAGPVAGVEIDGRWEWFRRLRGPKSRHALLRLLASGRLAKRLERRRAKQRSGRRR